MLNQYPVSGKLWTRDAGSADEGRKLVMVVGLIAVPDDFTPTDEDMHIVFGSVSGNSLMLTTGHLENVGDKTQGDDPTGILRKPLWQY